MGAETDEVLACTLDKVGAKAAAFVFFRARADKVAIDIGRGVFVGVGDIARAHMGGEGHIKFLAQNFPHAGGGKVAPEVLAVVHHLYRGKESVDGFLVILDGEAFGKGCAFVIRGRGTTKHHHVADLGRIVVGGCGYFVCLL